MGSDRKTLYTRYCWGQDASVGERSTHLSSVNCVQRAHINDKTLTFKKKQKNIKSTSTGFMQWILVKPVCVIFIWNGKQLDLTWTMLIEIIPVHFTTAEIMTKKFVTHCLNEINSHILEVKK